MQSKLSEDVKNMEQFISDNRLKINMEKTHMMRVSSRQRRMGGAEDELEIEVSGQEGVRPSKQQKLLGLTIGQDLNWRQHLLSSKGALIPSLHSKLRALRRARSCLDERGARMLANGVVMSTMAYAMEVWGGAGAYLLKRIQSVQLKAARITLRAKWRTRTEELLQKMKWLSINQMISFYGLCTLRRVIRTGSPSYLNSLIITEKNAISPRRFKDGKLGTFRRAVGKERCKAWLHSSVNLWNQLPVAIRLEEKETVFKKELRRWTLANIPIHRLEEAGNQDEEGDE